MALAGGGYDYDFVQNPPQRLICAICHLPCRDPQLSTCCGTNFCKVDIESFKKATSITKDCPVCRGNFESFVNHQANRDINELPVYCANRSAGCDWVGELNSLKPHREKSNGCLFEMLECPHGCDSEYQRQSLAVHTETSCPCYCQYCHTSADKEVISSQHKQKCHKFPAPCPNKCGETSILHEKMMIHRETCPLEQVDCLFADVGCAVKIIRKDRGNHNSKNTEKHLELTKIHISKMHADFAEVKASFEWKHKKLNQTVEELMKILQTKVTSNEVKAEQTRTSNSLNLIIKQKTTEVRQDAKANLLQEVTKLADKKSVEDLQRRVVNCKESIKQNEDNITAMRSDLNAKIDAIQNVVQDLTKRKRFCTYKTFEFIVIMMVAIIFFAIMIAALRNEKSYSIIL